jgi:hypothetical protein
MDHMIESDDISFDNKIERNVSILDEQGALKDSIVA